MTDPRAYSDEKLEAPAPLPHVARRALRRVKNPIPLPEVCQFCGGTPRIVGHEEIYSGRRYGEWPYAVACDFCDAYVGLHPHTDIPLGTLADKATRDARKAGKAAFFALQELRGWSRREAYEWLAGQLEIPVSDCHWGWFDAETAHQAEQVCEQELWRDA